MGIHRQSEITADEGAILQKRWEIIWTGAVTGVMGVVSGYAVFLLWFEESSHPWKLGLALFFAALLSLVFESLREKIQGEHATHGNPRGRLAISFVMVALAELFAMSWDRTASMNPETLRAAAKIITGNVFGRSQIINLAALGGLWISVGAVLAARLTAIIPKLNGLPLGASVRKAAFAGGLAGMLVAPLGLLAYVICVRFVFALVLIIGHHKQWLDHLDSLASGIHGGGPVALIKLGFITLSYLDGLLGGQWWSFLLAVVVLGGISVKFAKNDSYWSASILTLCLVSTIIAPLMVDWKSLGLMLVLAALIWTFPGLLLGALIPLLNRPSEVPRIWGLVAFGGGMILLLVTAIRFNAWFLVPAALLFTAGNLFRLGHRVEDFWPLVALSIAIIISGVTFLIQQATFAGVFAPFHEINTLSATVAKPSVVNPPGTSAWPKLGLWNPLTGDFSRYFPNGRSGAGLLAPDFNHPDPERELKQLQTSQSQLEGLRHEFEGLAAETQKLNSGLSKLRKETRDFPDEGVRDHVERIGELEEICGQFNKSITAVNQRVQDLEEARKQINLGVIITPGVAANQPLRIRVGAAMDLLRDDLARTLTDLQNCSHELKEVEQNIVAPERQKLAETAARWLELCLTGSLGFWVTIGLLAGWSIHRRGEISLHGSA